MAERICCSGIFGIIGTRPRQVKAVKRDKSKHYSNLTRIAAGRTMLNCGKATRRALGAT